MEHAVANDLRGTRGQVDVAPEVWMRIADLTLAGSLHALAPLVLEVQVEQVDGGVPNRRDVVRTVEDHVENDAARLRKAIHVVQGRRTARVVQLVGRLSRNDDLLEAGTRLPIGPHVRRRHEDALDPVAFDEIRKKSDVCHRIAVDDVYGCGVQQVRGLKHDVCSKVEMLHHATGRLGKDVSLRSCERAQVQGPIFVQHALGVARRARGIDRKARVVPVRLLVAAKIVLGFHDLSVKLVVEHVSA